jgi:hypothetical protein
MLCQYHKSHHVNIDKKLRYKLFNFMVTMKQNNMDDVSHFPIADTWIPNGGAQIRGMNNAASTWYSWL